MLEKEALKNPLQIKYFINPPKIAALLGGISIYLAGQSLLNEYLIQDVLSPDTHTTAILVLDLFSANAESTIPTWFSVLLIFMAAVLLGIIAKGKWELGDRFKYDWMALSIIFIYLSMDEGAAIHEIIVDPLQAIFHPTGYLAFGWQVVA